MRKLLKWIGIILVGLIGLLFLAAVFVTISSNSRINKIYDIQPEEVAIHNNDEILARGRHLVEIGCADCHGADLSGGTIIDEPSIASIYAGNLRGLRSNWTKIYGKRDVLRLENTGFQHLPSLNDVESLLQHTIPVIRSRFSLFLT